MFHKIVTALIFAVILPFASLASDGGPGQNKDEVPGIKEAPPGGDFTLNSADGSISLQDFRGKVVLLYFGYTKCPDVCPTSLSFLTQALNELAEEELQKVQAIFVSVDPKRDTPEILKEYAEYFHSNMIGVTGSEKEVAEVAALYGAQYYEVNLEGSAFGYSVNHSAVTYLITDDGTLRFIFPHATAPQVMLDAIRYVLTGN